MSEKEEKIDKVAENLSVEKENANAENRQELIAKAVKFLKNPKVAQTSEFARREFLLKKGLTDSEIKSAFEQANKFLKNNPPVYVATDFIPNTQTLPYNHNQLQTRPSMFGLLVKWIKNFLLAGCFAYATYKLIIKKYLLKKKKNIEIKNNIDTLLSSNQKLVDSIIEMKNSIKQLKDSIESMTNSIGQNSKIGQINMDESAIKAEIQTIKNLLLNRSQFPNLPAVLPVLPSWQLENKNVSRANSSASMSPENQKENETLLKEDD